MNRGMEKYTAPCTQLLLTQTLLTTVNREIPVPSLDGSLSKTQMHEPKL